MLSTIAVYAAIIRFIFILKILFQEFAKELFYVL